MTVRHVARATQTGAREIRYGAWRQQKATGCGDGAAGAAMARGRGSDANMELAVMELAAMELAAMELAAMELAAMELAITTYHAS